MDKIRTKFNTLPSWLKVILYTGVSQALGIILININNKQRHIGCSCCNNGVDNYEFVDKTEEKSFNDDVTPKEFINKGKLYRRVRHDFEVCVHVLCKNCHKE